MSTTVFVFIAFALFTFVGLVLTSNPRHIDPDHALIAGVLITIIMLLVIPPMGAAMLAALVLVTIISNM